MKFVELTGFTESLSSAIPRRVFRKLYRLAAPTLSRFSTFMPSTTLEETRPVLEFGRNDRLIVDLGMNDGTDTFFYLKKGFNVVAVEANPVVARQAERLLGRFVRTDRLRILNRGITDSASDDHLDFYINHKRSEWSSFVREIGCREGTPFSVARIAMLPIKELFREFGTPYYLKIDIEGFDQRIVNALSNLPLRPRFISVEEAGVGIVDALRRIGASDFKLVSQRNVPANKLPYPAREGRYCRHYFVGGSSGPFGDEAAGEWQPYDEFRLFYLSSVRDEKDNMIGDASDWFDIHARF
jgi:FkbM family methyltransferase